MIAIDTSSVVAFLAGASGPDVELLDHALATKQAILPPMVLSEILSDPGLPKPVADLLNAIPTLELLEGYWERVGTMRAKLLAKNRKARVADALIAQSCLDHKLGILTRDRNFRAFAQLCGLVLVH